MSLSVRRAWIEIRMALFPAPPTMVALRKESVDRNAMSRLIRSLLALSLSVRRAWIEIKMEIDGASYDVSLSVRRAWIEIILWNPNRLTRPVALRKESVDRNTSIDSLTQGVFKSLSVRRAWIEMQSLGLVFHWYSCRSP